MEEWSTSSWNSLEVASSRNRMGDGGVQVVEAPDLAIDGLVRVLVGRNRNHQDGEGKEGL